MLLLHNSRQQYDWGSITAIPQFAGEPVGDAPVAEEWMGTHPLGESLAVPSGGGEGAPLSSLT